MTIFMGTSISRFIVITCLTVITFCLVTYFGFNHLHTVVNGSHIGNLTWYISFLLGVVFGAFAVGIFITSFREIIRVFWFILTRKKTNNKETQLLCLQHLKTMGKCILLFVPIAAFVLAIS